MCLGFVRNFGSFVAVRVLLGIAEGGLLPGMVCTSFWVLRTLANLRRCCTFHPFIDEATWLFGLGCFILLPHYQALSEVCSSSFLLAVQTNDHPPGLLARGLAEIGPRGGLEGWRWIMIIEGLLVSELSRLIELLY
jgi:hypothetical protein